MRQQIFATVCNTERYVSINLSLQSSLVSSWGWDVPASIVYLKCIPSLLLCSWFAFWLLADLLVILQGKRISAAQSVMWKKKNYICFRGFLCTPYVSCSFGNGMMLSKLLWQVVKRFLKGSLWCFGRTSFIFCLHDSSKPMATAVCGFSPTAVLDVFTFSRYCTWLFCSFYSSFI